MKNFVKIYQTDITIFFRDKYLQKQNLKVSGSTDAHRISRHLWADHHGIVKSMDAKNANLGQFYKTFLGVQDLRPILGLRYQS